MNIGNKRNAEEQKKVIIDLVNRIKYEVTEAQLAELAGCASPLNEGEFVDWHGKIDDLQLATSSTGARTWLNGKQLAQLRALLHRIADVTRQVGGRAVGVGKRAIKWIFSLIARYPSTVAATMVMAALAFLASSVPFFGHVLLLIVQVVAVFLVGLIFISESVCGLNVSYAENN